MDAETIDAYLKAMEDMSDMDFRLAVEAATKTCERMPSPAQIRKSLQGSSRPSEDSRPKCPECDGYNWLRIYEHVEHWPDKTKMVTRSGISDLEPRQPTITHWDKDMRGHWTREGEVYVPCVCSGGPQYRGLTA